VLPRIRSTGAEEANDRCVTFCCFDAEVHRACVQAREQLLRQSLLPLWTEADVAKWADGAGSDPRGPGCAQQ